jgi:hypothetical protein
LARKREKFEVVYCLRSRPRRTGVQINPEVRGRASRSNRIGQVGQ